MLPPEALCKDVCFRGDLDGSKLQGRDAYVAAATQWHADCTRELAYYHTELLRCDTLSTTSDELVSYRWRAQWHSEAQRPLRTLARLVGWRIIEFDLDPQAVSTFSWAAVFQLLWAAARSGELKLPASAVEGRAEVHLDTVSGVVIAHTETLDGVRAADGRRLLNRKVAQDVATLLDFRRRPGSVPSPDEWASAVSARVLRSVPGAGVLDVDPNEDPRAVVAFATLVASVLVVSIAGIGDETGVFGRTACDEVVVAASELGFDQCVSDLFRRG